MKYNYVIFGSASDFLRTAYTDIGKCDWARYLYRPIDSDSRLLTTLYRIHTSPRTNRFFKLPGQEIWNRVAFQKGFTDNKPLCFVFFAQKRWFDNGLVAYLRKKYPDCKTVLFCQDLVRYSFKDGFVPIQKQMDLCLSFDHEDARRHGMDYYPLVYSAFEIPADDSIPQSDVYFVGKAKDRLPQILSVYEKLSGAGLKCDFYITGVKLEDQKYADEIHYGGQMPYIENLKHIRATKCLLEIMQGGGHGYTLRTCEAIMYDKKMITDNPQIEHAPIFAKERIQVFRETSGIDPAFVNAEPVAVDYGWKDQLSPIHLLEYIDGKL